MLAQVSGVLQVPRIGSMERVISLCLCVVVLSSSVSCLTWPVPYKRYESRPNTNSYCKALYPFCPTGVKAGYISPLQASDVVEVFVLKAPVWEFKFGNLLSNLHIVHDAIGFRSQLTGKNYTTEWYELFQLFNCTFPHVLDKQSPPLWCNQGAACFYEGIDDIHWKQNGTLEKVMEMTGSQFNQLAEYILMDNVTGLYYETWRVRNTTEANFTEWFTPFDCASYVMRVLKKVIDVGGKIVSDSKGQNYTFITLYSDMPQYLGNVSTIFGPKGNASLAASLINFYGYFKAHQPILSFFESLYEIYKYVFLENEFFFYYNSEYWLLPMKSPHVKLTYEFVSYNRTVG